MIKYAIIVLTTVCLVLAGAAWWYQSKAQRLSQQIDILKVQNANCNKRIKSVLEAQRDVQKADDWPDLGTVPDGWLLPETSTGD